AHEYVVEPVAHPAVRVDPAAIAAQVAVESAEGVAVAVFGEPDHDAELGAVVALAVIRPEPPAARARERAHLALARLVLRRVQVAAENARQLRWLGQLRRHGLERADLHPVALARDRRVQVVELGGLSLDAHARD